MILQLGSSGWGNRIGLKGAKGSGEQGEPKGAMEDKGGGGPRLFLHQIIDFAPAPAKPVF